MASRADELVRIFRNQHEGCRVYFRGDESKVPGWFLHLPSGVVMRVRRFQADPPMLRVWGTEASKDVVDVVLIAPESVALSIRTLAADEDVFEVVFSTNGDEPWRAARARRTARRRSHVESRRSSSAAADCSLTCSLQVLAPSDRSASLARRWD